jgi:hypothetical protein
MSHDMYYAHYITLHSSVTETSNHRCSCKNILFIMIAVPFFNHVRDIQQMLIIRFYCAHYFPYMFRLPGAIFRGATISLFISYSRFSAFRVGVGLWCTEGGRVWWVQPPPQPPKFRSFAKAAPNSQFLGIYIRNNLIRIWVSFAN